MPTSGSGPGGVVRHARLPGGVYTPPGVRVHTRGGYGESCYTRIELI